MLFVAGPHGAGKTHASQELEALGFASIDLGPTIRNHYKKYNIGLDFHDWIIEEEKIHGLQFTDELLLIEVKKKIYSINNNPDIKDLIILGSRSLNNIRYISEGFKKSNVEPKVIYIDAEKDLLKSRYEMREQKNISEEEFEQVLYKDEKMGLLTIKDAADFVILNNGSKHDLSLKLKSALSQFGYILDVAPSKTFLPQQKVA